MKFLDNNAGSSDNQNLRRLMLLRYITSAIIVAGVLLGDVILDSYLNHTVLFGVVGANIVFNLLTRAQLGHQLVISHHAFFFQLIYDVASFTIVLYFSGGAMNPFAWYFLLYIILSAILLPPRFTWTMATVTVLAYSVLINFYVDLPGTDAHAHHGGMDHSESFSQHIFGMWFGFILSAFLVVYFMINIANTLRERDEKLVEAREDALRNERLVSLGTLAAGAAHELGTPLGTMAIITHELERNYKEDSNLQGQLKILSDQVDRCKEALSVMSASAGEARAESGGPINASQLMRSVIAKWQGQRPDTQLNSELENINAETIVIADMTLTQAFINILNNAADASPDYVGLFAETTDSELIVRIVDHGDGWNDEAAAQVGKSLYSSKDQGMGVGLYLAHASIERMGGSISIDPHEPKGTCVSLRLPLMF